MTKDKLDLVGAGLMALGMLAAAAGAITVGAAIDAGQVVPAWGLTGQQAHAFALSLCLGMCATSALFAFLMVAFACPRRVEA